MEQRRVEGELQEQEALLQKLEGQQLQVKSNEAYTALLHEMERARQAISDCETRILESMETIEAATAVRLRGRGGGGRGSRAGGDRGEGPRRAREGAGRRKWPGCARSATALCARIESGVLTQYKRIASRRRPAVVRISHEMCLGCRVNIPPQNYIEILKAERIITCGNCHRILIQESKVVAPAAS